MSEDIQLMKKNRDSIRYISAYTNELLREVHLIGSEPCLRVLIQHEDIDSKFSGELCWLRHDVKGFEKRVDKLMDQYCPGTDPA